MQSKSLVKYIRQGIPVLFIFVLFSFSIMAIVSELKKDSIESVGLYLKSIPHGHKLTALVMTIFGYGLMTGYDLLGFAHIRQKLSPLKVAFTAFISYAVGNTVGFSVLSGSAIRYHYYGLAGISQVKITELIVFTHLTFWLGLLSIGGVVSLIDPLTLPTTLKLPFDSIHPLGYIFLSLVLIYFILSITLKHSLKLKGEEITFPQSIISSGTIIITALDWGLAAGVLYLLLPISDSITYIGFFGIYIIALITGLISNVPGGLGVFETVMLYLRPQSVSPADMLGGLIAYRIVYFFIPLIVALVLIGIQAWKTKK